MTTRQDTLIAARRKLMADPGFSALIGVDVGKDATSGAYSDGWVFRAIDDNLTPDRNPRNSGKSTVTLGLRHSWTNPNRHNTLSFPLLNVSILSDNTRGSDPSLLIAKDAADRCFRVADAIRPVFNDVANRTHFWPNDVFVISCVLWTDANVIDVNGEDGLVEGSMSFALEIG